MAESFQIPSLFILDEDQPASSSLAMPASKNFSSLREKAKHFLQQQGTPHRKVESWRFTPLRSLLNTTFQKPSSTDPTTNLKSAQHWQEKQDQTTAWIVWHPNQPTFKINHHNDSISLSTFSNLSKEQQDHFLKHALHPKKSANHFSALNDLFFQNGIFLQVAANAVLSQPIFVIYPEEFSPSSIDFPRLFVHIEPNAQVELIEIFAGDSQGKTFTNHINETILESGAVLKHTRVHHSSGFVISNTHITQEQQSQYENQVFSLSGKLSRLDLHLQLMGQGANCRLNGVYHATDDEIIDHHLFVEHMATHCTSHQNYRGIIQGKGHAVFDGIIKVHRDAQQSSAHQKNKNLLLSDEGVIHTKPHLEIDADDVSCTHGATVGALDEKQLFYLRSRGISEEKAKAILTLAFTGSLVEEVRPHWLREEISRILQQKTSTLFHKENL